MKWNAANLYDVHLLVLYLASKYFCRRVEGDDYFPIARDSLDCLPCTTPPLPPPPPPPGKLRPKRRRFVREVKLLIRHRQWRSGPDGGANEGGFGMDGMERMEGCNAPLILNFAVAEQRVSCHSFTLSPPPTVVAYFSHSVIMKKI